MRRTVPVGRPKKVDGEALTNRTVAFPVELIDRLEAQATEASAAGAGTVTFSHLVRKACESLLNPTPIKVHDLDSKPFKFLTKAPAGPWGDAMQHAGTHYLSTDTATELGAKEGDVVVRAVGESLEGAGIPDGALLLMRPLMGRMPARNSITLVQIVNEAEEYQGTIKKWISQQRLLDGNDDEFAIPEKTVMVQPVAEAVGLISRIY